mgnify:CR=1 FL=1
MNRSHDTIRNLLVCFNTPEMRLSIGQQWTPFVQECVNMAKEVLQDDENYDLDEYDYEDDDPFVSQCITDDSYEQRERDFYADADVD